MPPSTTVVWITCFYDENGGLQPVRARSGDNDRKFEIPGAHFRAFCVNCDAGDRARGGAGGREVVLRPMSELTGTNRPYRIRSNFVLFPKDEMKAFLPSSQE